MSLSLSGRILGKYFRLTKSPPALFLRLLQFIRRRLLLPLQLFAVVFLLGAWWTVPKIEADLARRATAILRDMGLEGQVRLVRFEGPVASLAGTVTTPEARDRLIQRLESMENLWGLRVKNPQAIQIIPPAIPVSYRLDFAPRAIKLTGQLPGETEKKGLARKLQKLFPKSTLTDLSTVVTNTTNAGVAPQLLEHLPELNALGQLRWVSMEDGFLTLSANLPNPATQQMLMEKLAELGEHARAEDLHIIGTPTLEMKFATGQIQLSGEIGEASDQEATIEFVKALFPKAKVEGHFTINEQLGPVDWLLPKLQPLPALQKLGRLLHVVFRDAEPVVEAETANASAQISMTAAIEEAYRKEVKTSVVIAAPVINTATGPSFWAEVGEEDTRLTASVADEAGKTLLLEKLAVLFPKTKFTPTVTLNPALASSRLFLLQLDPLADVPVIESSFILRGFGLVEGRLKIGGLVPDEATKDRLSGMVLKRFQGRVTLDIAVDAAYLPSPEAYWAGEFSAGKLLLKGQVSSKALATSLLSELQEAYPRLTIENALEILPSGLRAGDWSTWLPGLNVVAAPEQTIQLSWQNNHLTLSTRTPSELGKQRMLHRLHRTFNDKITAQIEVVADAALADQPAVTLVDCIIYLESGQSDFMAANVRTLEQVLELMQVHPDLKISINSHTDAKGAFNANLNTSQQRAETVRKWLLRRQIDPSRITAQGFGSKRPIADMKTELGRDANRRLEFHVR